MQPNGKTPPMMIPGAARVKMLYKMNFRKLKIIGLYAWSITTNMGESVSGQDDTNPAFSLATSAAKMVR